MFVYKRDYYDDNIDTEPKKIEVYTDKQHKTLDYDFDNISNYILKV